MKDHSGCRRAFVWSSKARYASSRIINECGHEIMFGMYHPNDGTTSGEMMMRWKGVSDPVPQLRVFDDAWSALATFTDLIQELEKVGNEGIAPEQFIEILLSCGFVDDTKYTSPYEPKETLIRKKLTEAQREVERLEASLLTQRGK